MGMSYQTLQAAGVHKWILQFFAQEVSLHIHPRDTPKIILPKLANSLQLPIIDALSKYYDSKEI